MFYLLKFKKLTMPKFKVEVTRRVDTSKTVFVDAKDPNFAAIKAINTAVDDGFV